MIRYGWMLSAVALMACAPFQPFFHPGARVTPEISQRWGCDWADLSQRIEDLRETVADGSYWTPRVGWSSCMVLANIGAPTEVDRQETTMGRSASWWYHRTNTDARLLSLDLDAESGYWIVTYVGW